MALIQLPWGESDWYDFDRKIALVNEYVGGPVIALYGFAAEPIYLEFFEQDEEKKMRERRDEIAHFINRTLHTQNNPINAEDTLRKLLDDAHAAAQTHHKDHPIHKALSEVTILVSHGSITDISAWQLDTLRRHVLAHQQNKAGRD